MIPTIVAYMDTVGVYQPNAVRIHADTTAITTPKMEPRDRYFEMNVTGRKTSSAKAADTGVKINKLPNAGAIPRPPLNPKNTDQLCPTTTSSNINTIIQLLYIKLEVTKTAIPPLRQSNINTEKPIYFPDVRNILDVPIFPLPYSLISLPVLILYTMYPQGTEPKRYSCKPITAYKGMEPNDSP